MIHVFPIGSSMQNIHPIQSFCYRNFSEIVLSFTNHHDTCFKKRALFYRYVRAYFMFTLSFIIYAIRHVLQTRWMMYMLKYSKPVYRYYWNRSRPCIILDSKFPRLVLQAFPKVLFLRQFFLDQTIQKGSNKVILIGL